ncbi:MAG: D-alanine--D-alanine ligase [Clostridia bacterium]|nr:D-alanine--D-alanine ligase [Clostridia bacterium]
MKKVAIFFGGVTCEHDVSLITGVMALNSLKGSDYEPVAVYIDRNGEWYGGDKLTDLGFYSSFDKKKCVKLFMRPGESALYRYKKNKLKLHTEIDAAINCMHGLNGEDGSLAGLLQLCDVPLASPPMFASSASMDKYYTKLLLAGLEVAFLPYLRLKRSNYDGGREYTLKFIEKRLDYPIIVKPANLGSSIGISKATDREGLTLALDKAFGYDEKVIVEHALSDFREINCACYKSGDKYFVSECEEPLLRGDILSFEDKYKSAPEKIFPANIDKKISDKIKETVKFVYRKLDFKGVIRIDFLVKDDKIYLNEINSVPGSLAYYLFCDSTEELSDFLGVLIEDAIEEHKKFKANIFTFDGGNIASGIKGKL